MYVLLYTFFKSSYTEYTIWECDRFIEWYSERVTGRKARYLQMEEIGCKCLLKFCVAVMTPGSTWT